MASFYGPNSTTLGGLPFPGQSSDPVTSAILARFPQLRGQTGGPTALSQLGYTAPGLDYGQGQGGLGALTLFEGAKPVFSESITGGLALGTLGKSGSQTPAGGGAAANVGNQLQLGALPAFPAASLSDIGMAPGEPQTVATGGEGAGTGGSLDVGSIVSAGQGAYDVLAGTGGGQVFDPQGQTQSQAFQQQRIGERDYSNLTGSPSGIPQLPLPSYFSTGERATTPTGVLGPTPAGAGDFLLGGGGPLTQQFGTQGNRLTPDQLDIRALLESGLTPDQMMEVFGGAEQTLTGGPIFAPSTPTPSSGGVKPPDFNYGNIINALSAGSGAFGLYDAIKRFDENPTASSLQAVQSAAQLYSGIAPIANQAFGTNLPALTDLGTSLLSNVTSPQVASAVKDVFSSTGSGAASGLSGLNSVGGYSNILGLVLAAAQPFMKQDRDNAALMSTAQSALNAISIATSTNPYTAAVMAAIAQAMSLYQSLEAGYGADQTIANLAVAPFMSFLGAGGQGLTEMLNEAWLPSRAWRSFVPQMMQQQQQQGTAFSTLQQALPYVQSKEELGRLLNSYKNYLGTTTGLTPEQYGGSYPGDPYAISKIGGTTGTEHGVATPRIDWGPQTQALQGLIEEYMNYLPGERITAAYGQPGGGLEGEAARRLWQQFLLNAPYMDAQDAATGLPLQSFPVYSGAGQPYTPVLPLGGDRPIIGYEDRYFVDEGGQLSPEVPIYGPRPQGYTIQDIVAGQHAGTVSQGPSWDPATGQWVLTRGATPPKPSDYFQQSSYWQQMFDAPVQAYQQQLAQYQQQADAWWQNALNLQPLTLPTVEAPGVLPGVPGQNAQAFAPQTLTGGGLTPEQLAWLRSQGWLQ